VFLSLHLLNDFGSEDAREIVRRDKRAWIKLFRQLPEDRNLGMHELALLRCILESAGHTTDTKQNRFEMRWSAKKNLAKLEYILRIYDYLEATEPVFFDRFDAQEMREALRQFGRFETSELEELRVQMLQHVPIGFSGVTLPSHLSYNVAQGTMMGFQSRR